VNSRPRPPQTSDDPSASSDPFEETDEIAVKGGSLHVARAGARPEDAGSVVLAVHGVTASLMTWRTVARAVPPLGDVCLLAPDLRGRGRSATLPGPYGIGAHVDDLIDVLDHVGAQRAVLVGHSLGAYVGARLAAEHPERVAALVLLDAGLPLPAPEEPEEMLQSAVASAIMRLQITFPSAEDYISGWRAHPAFADAWNDDVEAYARYDLVEHDHRTRCGASAPAVRADSAEMVLDQTTRLALERVPAETPVQLLRAPRGLFDDEDNPLIPADLLRGFAAEHPEVRIENVPKVNHYTLVMGDSPGPARVAAAIERACRPAG
jgi:pimeloyl-ACP methyl ester carboxylesterase